MTDPNADITVIIDKQVADGLEDENLPSEELLEAWLKCVFLSQAISNKEITIRFVGNIESQDLNNTYRAKAKPTNVLSFPFETIPGIDLPLLGDLIVCVPVIIEESKQQQKLELHHYAHMIIHGCLHLLGFDHIENDEADQMEALEIQLLANLGIDDPYQEL